MSTIHVLLSRKLSTINSYPIASVSMRANVKQDVIDHPHSPVLRYNKSTLIRSPALIWYIYLA